MIQKTEAEIMKNWQGDPDHPLVSIRCIVYNQEKYIEQCLDGFLMQETTFPFEAVVHDDASTDRTADIIREYEKKYPTIIRPIYETENQYSKHNGSLIRIMDSAMRGKYVAACEGDDYWTDSKKLQLQAEALENNPDCTIAFNRVRFVEEDGSEQNLFAPAIDSCFGQKITLKDYCYEEFKTGRWAFHTSSFFYRQNMDKPYTEFRTDRFSVCPYGDMSRQLFLLMNGKGFFVDRIMGYYRTNSVSSYHRKLEADWQYNKNQICRLIESLKQFDQMTDYQYHEDIEYRIRREEFYVLQKEKKVIEMLSPRYRKAIPFSFRIKKTAEALFPKVYLRTKGIYHKIRKH